MARLARGNGTRVYRFTVTVNHNTGALVMIQTDVDISSLGLVSIARAAERLKGWVINGLSLAHVRLLITSVGNLRVFSIAQLDNYTVTVEVEIEVGPSLTVQRIISSYITQSSDYCGEASEPIDSVLDTSRAEAVNNGATISTASVLHNKVKLTAVNTLHSKTKGGNGTTVTANSLVVRRAA